MSTINALQKTTFTLYELNCLVSKTIADNLDNDYWLEAELSEIREVRGNCYMEYIQKDLTGSTPVAKASAKCWKNRWPFIRQNFERMTGQTFHAGMKGLFKVHADFHPAFGFSWIVSDVDAAYTLGDMARKRLEIILRLKEEGVFDLQKGLLLPMFANRIAVISNDNAAGYGDFCNQINANSYGFAFTVKLFPAVMQGERVEQSIIKALEDVYAAADNFDVVVIIRGGGATSDLSGFDTLALAENVANFPLPIITGIGHERDESILDMVSNTRVKTPTAAAALFIDNLATVSNHIEDMRISIINNVSHRMQTEHTRMKSISQRIPLLFSVVKTRNSAILDKYSVRMSTAIRRILTDENHNIEMLVSNLRSVITLDMTRRKDCLLQIESKLSVLDPHKLLRRGYSITLKDGHAVTDISVLKNGDDITTILDKGTIKSKIHEFNKSNIL
jgi:exodeoxyribonuclease VII large subunit